MRLLVIGGTGFVSSHIVRSFVERGHDVTLFHRGRTDADLPNTVGQIIGNRASLTTFKEQFRNHDPEVVIDAVPMTERDALDVMDVFDGIVRRVIALSSVDVYRAFSIANGKVLEPPEPAPISEDGRLRDHLFPYRGVFEGFDNYEKILVERAVLGHPSLPGTILRLAMVYGPGDVQHRIHPYLQRMDDGRPAILLASHHASWRSPRVYVENVAHAVVLAAENDRASGRIYNVADREAFTEAEWVRHIGNATGWNGEILTPPPDVLPEAMRMAWLNAKQDVSLDTSHIREELGYDDLVGVGEGLRRTVDWERGHRLQGLRDDRGWETRQTFDYDAEDRVLAALGTGRRG